MRIMLRMDSRGETLMNILKHVFKNDPDQEATMMQAKWNGKVVAQSDRTIVVVRKPLFSAGCYQRGIFSGKQQAYCMPIERLSQLL
jgi:hypothetical protein